MTILADTYDDENDRQYAMGLALGGLGLGLSVGPPFGGAAYQYFGREAPFLILCGLIFIDGCRYRTKLMIMFVFYNESCQCLFLTNGKRWTKVGFLENFKVHICT